MFYVYVYRDPRPTKKLQPIYVGKGHGDRAWQHWKKRVVKNSLFGGILAKIRYLGLEPVIEIVFETSVEQEAFDEEKRLIALYGRRDLGKGPLANQTDGGDGVRGFVPTEESRAVYGRNSKARWSNAQTAQRMVEAQRKAQGAPEARALKSANSKAVWGTKRDKIVAAISKARQTPESRAKTSAQAAVQWDSVRYRTKQTKNNQAIANRPEVKAAKSAATKALWQDPEFVARQKAAREIGVESLKKSVIAVTPEGERLFASVSEVITTLGVNKTSLHAALKSGAPIKKGAFKGWVFQYAVKPLDPTAT